MEFSQEMQKLKSKSRSWLMYNIEQINRFDDQNSIVIVLSKKNATF